jgi:hypothetical protein
MATKSYTTSKLKVLFEETTGPKESQGLFVVDFQKEVGLGISNIETAASSSMASTLELGSQTSELNNQSIELDRDTEILTTTSEEICDDLDCMNSQADELVQNIQLKLDHIEKHK